MLEDLYLNADTLRSLSASRNQLRPGQGQVQLQSMAYLLARNMPNYLRRFQVPAA